jgi:DNA repair photolyase
VVRYIEAKQILTPMPRPESWFGVGYGMNLYRGCQHGCIYCDSRSACYGVERFDEDIEIKQNAIELLERELAAKRVRKMIGSGAMCDPYGPVERDIELTRRAVSCIVDRGFSLHIMTKSDMVIRDLSLLTGGMVRNAVTFTVTTPGDGLAAEVEPGAPAPSRRFAAMAALSRAGIVTGVAVMPVLPFLEDDEDALLTILEKTKEAGGTYAVVGLGVTLRDRQRVHFYRKLDAHFPGIRQKYEAAYGEQYQCPVPDAQRLYGVLEKACEKRGLAWGMVGAVSRIHPREEQMSLFT